MANQLASEFGGEFDNREEIVRDALQLLRQRDEDLSTIQAGLADMNAGRYRPIAEVDAEIRKELGFSSEDE